MMDKIKELIKKKAKEGKFISEEDKSARMDILNELKDMAQGEMGHGLGKLKKVTVASDSAEGLKQGLEKAGEVVDKKMGECDVCKDGETCPKCKMESMMEDSTEAPEAEGSVSDEEIDPESDSEDLAEGSEEVAPEMSKEEKIKKLEAELAALKA
jgi:hypothetical protein